MKPAKSIEHVAVYRKPGRFAGWPANYGMWSWGDEILIVFTEGAFKNQPVGHKRDKSQPFTTLQGRSLDGGVVWSIEAFNGCTPANRGLSADEHMESDLQIGDPYEWENPPIPLPEGIDFTDPDNVVMVARTTCKGVPGGVYSWFHVSKDCCRSWAGPYSFTGLDSSLMLASRTDILPLDSGHALFLITAQKSNGEEGRVLCAETRNGGQSFRFLSWLNHGEPTGFEIMPSSLLYPNGRVLTAVRAYSEDKVGTIKMYESVDAGNSWNTLAPAVESMVGYSNPPALVRLGSGRICLLYGCRSHPFSIRARISDDEGKTWSDDIVLRDDGGDFDIGYPRAVLRADGKVVTGYYYNTHTDEERFIAATIWDAEEE
jgi:hypothetical protein